MNWTLSVVLRQPRALLPRRSPKQEYFMDFYFSDFSLGEREVREIYMPINSHARSYQLDLKAGVFLVISPLSSDG